MGLIDSLLRRPPPVRDFAALTDFLDRNAAFLTQKAIFEYARARSGLLSSKLFKEEAFRIAIEESRWRSFPLSLQCVALMVEYALRREAGDAGDAVRRGLMASVEEICGRYPLPPGFEPDFWRDSASAIGQRIARAGLAPPHPVKDIPKELAETFFRNLPIHGALRGNDFEMTTNNLRFNLCRAHESFIAVADMPALVDALAAAGRSRAVG